MFYEYDWTDSICLHCNLFICVIHVYINVYVYVYVRMVCWRWCTCICIVLLMHDFCFVLLLVLLLLLLDLTDDVIAASLSMVSAVWLFAPNRFLESSVQVITGCGAQSFFSRSHSYFSKLMLMPIFYVRSVIHIRCVRVCTRVFV